MSKRMLIDAAHPEETRVAIIDPSHSLLEFDFNSTFKKTFKGNIYLAKIARIEPSLQAAFIDYGGERHGFLAFNEIHPDYFRIPIADREELQQEILNLSKEPDMPESADTVGEEEDRSSNENSAGNRRFASLHRRYKIQEVLHKGQIVLIQVVKEERGGKGAALTTFLSLPGRYCVLMPNSPRSGGVSRKISNQTDRARLKKSLDALDLPEGMGLIVRTAGKDRTRTEIKKDAEYLMRLWNNIREITLGSIAPSVIYQEDDIIKRAIRDMYSREVDEVLVEGDEGYKVAKNFMKTLMPSHAKKVKQYKDSRVPLFHVYGLEAQLETMYRPQVFLPSGGSIVIHPTEALVSIDINSGRSTRERHIEETAFKTNLEAATEIARQVRLRDLAGLVVIDFIDMDDSRNIAAVERRVKESFKHDRARIQMGKISSFGLLELSRQRLSPSILETSAHMCLHCHGTGYQRSTESLAVHVLRLIEQECLKGMVKQLLIKVSRDVAFYIFNKKRAILNAIEERQKTQIFIEPEETLGPEGVTILATHYTKEEFEALGEIFGPLPLPAPLQVEDTSDDVDTPDMPEPSQDLDKEDRKGKRNRRNQRRNRNRAKPIEGGDNKDSQLPEENALEVSSPSSSDIAQPIQLSETPDSQVVLGEESHGAKKSMQKRKRRRKPSSQGHSTEQNTPVGIEANQESTPETQTKEIEQGTLPSDILSQANESKDEASALTKSRPHVKGIRKERKTFVEKHEEAKEAAKQEVKAVEPKGDGFILSPIDALALSPSLHSTQPGDVVAPSKAAPKKSNKTWWRRILNSQGTGPQG